MPRRPRVRPLTLNEITAPIILPQSVGWSEPVQLTITWRTKNPSTQVLDVEHHQAIPREHHFAATITQTDLEAAHDLSEEVVQAAWDALTSLPGVRTELSPEGDEDGAVLGVLKVMELHDGIRQASRSSWFMWLDEQGTNVGEVADRISENDDDFGFSLLGGSLLWFRELDVHPAFRGMRIGAKLLAHALWFLVADLEDVALLEAYPKIGSFDRERFPETQATVRRLARYYESLGFRPWRFPKERRQGRIAEHIAMYFLNEPAPEWVRELEGLDR